jgi:hypothetical protein
VKELSRQRSEAGKKGGKAKANGLANARAGDVANDTSSRQDVAQAEECRGEETSSSSVSDLQAATASGEEEEDSPKVANLWKAWAHRRLQERRESGKGEPFDTDRWLTAVALDLSEKHRSEALKVLAKWPTATTNEVLDRLAGPRLAVVQDGHQRHRTDWGATSDEVWDELPDGSVVRRGTAS